MSYTIPQLAAFIDGEGCFSIHKQARRYGAALRIGNTFLPVLQFYKDTFGGGISLSNNNGKQAYQWDLSGSSLIPCLEALIPHLWEKKPQAELLLEYYWKYGGRKGQRRWKYEKLEQEWYYRRLRELKQDQTEVEETPRPEEPATQLRLVI